jgi:hypothetical protein
MKEQLKLLIKIFRYNQKIIFANKFIYFLLAAIGFYLLTATISLFSDTIFEVSTLYTITLIPGMLLIFYPACFGIQNDQDSKIIEILFGIPNYRYKVWLVRLGMIYFTTSIIVFLLLLVANILLIDMNPLGLMANLLFPLIMIGNLAFFISTFTRSGNGTAVIIIVIGFVYFVLQGTLQESQWNIFLNPYLTNLKTNPLIWDKILINNKIFTSVIAIVTLVWGLLNMQKREKFI